MGATLITSREVKLDELTAIEMPEATNTYVPVSHYDLAMNVGSIGERVIDKELHSKRFGTARKGQHMFGVCENLMMTGEVTFMRKHTGNILDELNSLIFKVLYNSDDKFVQLQEDKESMKEIDISNQQAWQTMGILY